MIVGVSDEGLGTLKKWTEERGVRYPVVHAPKGLATYGVRAYPTVFTVDERGKIAQRGELTAGQIEERLQRVRWLPDLGNSPLLRSLRELWEDGKLAELDKKLADAAADADLGATDRAGVDRLRTLFDKLRDVTQKDIDSANQGPDYIAVEDRLREIERLWSGLPLAAAAKTAQAALRQDQRIKTELDAGRKLREIVTRFGGDKKQLAAQLQSLVKKHPGTQAATQAQELLKRR